nr:ATP synthase F0 subunit 6 [Trichophilopterus babakotophilus]
MLLSIMSVFDPSSHFLFMLSSINWLTMFVIFFFLNWNFWMNFSGLNMIIKNMIKYLIEELQEGFKNFKSTMFFLVSIFFIIFFSNQSGMIPYVFTVTSHIVFNLSLSFPLWFGGLIFMFSSSMKKSLAHLVPQGSPTILIPFLVLIETTSLMIRPFSLAIRLMSNIMAGHMILVLIGSSLSILSSFFGLIVLFQFFFIIFEIAVAMIQAYVFTKLLSLFWQENEVL